MHHDFNPRPPTRGATSRCPTRTPGERFQSTPPARGATGDAGGQHRCETISIHAPREGGDPRRFLCPTPTVSFQSTPPREGSDYACLEKLAEEINISIHAPARGATGKQCYEALENNISIHAPREGGRPSRCWSAGGCPSNFNPRPPRGGRPLTPNLVSR